MNKRLGLLSLFGITALLLAMVGAITAMAAPSAANTNGTIVLDKAWYTVDGSVEVKVTDPDANVSTASTVDRTVATSTALGIQLINVPLDALQRVGSPKVLLAGQTCPSGTVDTNLSVSVFGDGSTGNIVVQNALDIGASTRPVCYNRIKLDTVPITIKSTQDSTGLVDIIATETDVDTGIFKVTVTLKEAASSSTAKWLKSANGDLITAEYTDLTPASGTSLKVTSVASKVETQKPTFSNLLPADKFRTTATQVTFTGSITDTGGSGVDIGTISLVINSVPTAPTTITGNKGDTTVTYSYTLSTPAETAYAWYVESKDVAGNLGRSDSDTTVVSDQNHALNIDKTAPKITSAKTGKYWDLSLTVPAEGKDKLTGIVVTFDGDLDIGSVQAADFSVTGNSVTVADIYTDADGVGKNKVYLTLGTSLARDATPTVAIVSGQSVADAAGNVLGAGSADATTVALDGIAPSFSFSLDKTITKDTVVATVTSTETVAGGTFAVKAYPDAGIVGGVVTDFAVVSTGTNSWTATFTKVAGKDGKYAVYVTGNDVAGNAGKAGKNTTTDPAAKIFTQDTTVPAPVFTVGIVDFTAAAVDVEGTSPLVSVNFGEKVTMVRGSFDGVDVLAKGTQSTDKKTWLYQASGLTVGKTYEVIVSATDEAGNKLVDKSAKFNTIEVKLPEFPLEPGQNMISFSGNPVVGDINTVFSDAAVTAVVTYDAVNPDPKTGSPFLTAVRGTDGKLSGSLTKVDGQHGYFVKASGFVTLKVEIAKLGFDAVPTTIAVKGKAWNLVPVVSVEGLKPLASGKSCDPASANYVAASCVSADAYLSTIKWTTAYTYNPITNAWTKIQPKSFANLEIGASYWVYVSEDGVLVP